MEMIKPGMTVKLCDWVSEVHFHSCCMFFSQAVIDDAKRFTVRVDLMGENGGFFEGPYIYVVGSVISGYFRPCYFEPCKDPAPI
jgi:hypothetical protein